MSVHVSMNFIEFTECIKLLYYCIRCQGYYSAIYSVVHSSVSVNAFAIFFFFRISRHVAFVCFRLVDEI